MSTETQNEGIIPYQVFNDDLYFLSREQAEKADAALANSHDITAILFTVFVGLRGHAALGMTLEQYCEHRGISRQTAFRWFIQVEVALNLCCMTGTTLAEQVEKDVITLALPSVRAASVLRSLPPVKQREAVERYEAVMGKSITAKSGVKIDQLERIVLHLSPAPVAIYVPPTTPEENDRSASCVTRVLHEKEEANETPAPVSSPRTVLPPVAPSEKPLRPVLPTEIESDEEAEPEFDEGDMPDFIATDVEYGISPAGYWITIPKDNPPVHGENWVVFVREDQIVGAPTR